MTEELLLLDLMESELFVATQLMNGQPLVCMPFAIDDTPNLYPQWVKRFPGEVPTAMDILNS